MRRSAPSVVAISGTISGTLCVAFLLAACGPSAPAPQTSGPSSSTTTAPTATTSATASPTASSSTSGSPGASSSATSSAGWKSYTTKDGKLAFDLPDVWTIKDPAGDVPSGGGVFLQVRSPGGKLLATLRTNVVTAGQCAQKYPYSVLDSESMPALAQAGSTPRFTFESRMNVEATDPKLTSIFEYGITSVPEPTGPTACPIVHSFNWPPNQASFAGSYDPFDTTPGNEPNVDTPEIYKGTTEYQNIRKMITSLHPVG